jgi:uracil-DNA glycosylase
MKSWKQRETRRSTMGLISEQWWSEKNRHWNQFLAPEIPRDYFKEIEEQLKEDYAVTKVYPPVPDIFKAFVCTPPDELKVVLLGQDPYHGPGQAEGLAFSFLGQGKFPASLRRIVQELEIEQFLTPAQRKELPQRQGKPLSLVSWARQGVFLLNCSLTVREGAPGSHLKYWKPFTDLVIDAVASRIQTPLVFLLWGGFAKNYADRVRELSGGRHHILTAPHPSPLSRGFLGHARLRETSQLLESEGLGAVAWESILDQSPQEKSCA